MHNITQYLLSEGLLTIDQVKVLELEAASSKTDTESCVVSLGLLSKEMLSRALAKQSASETVDLRAININQQVASKLDKSFCLKNKLIAFEENEQCVCIAALKKPDLPVRDSIRAIYSKQLKFFVATEDQLLESISSVYDEKKTISTWMEILEAEYDLNESFATKLIYELLGECVKDNISDIHFEPEEYFVRIRLRKDGVLKQLCIFPKEKWSSICIRMKVLAEMDITQHFISQDGKFNLNLFGNNVDFRVSAHPVVHGENIVVRILDRKKDLFNLEKLGYSQDNLNQLDKILRQKNGLFIVTGPTGSGKSTLLFSMLLKLNSESLSITTIEEPVEYCFPYFRQIDMHAHSNMTFSQAIRSILRQDPDIIAINEIRDSDTAINALRAAMTGRMLLTTLHSHSVFGIFDRMEDLGINKKMLIQNLSGIATQRLVRKLCEHCKQIHTPTEKERALLSGFNIEKIAKSKGCEKCNFSGYNGRIAVAEILHVSQDIKRMLLDKQTYEVEDDVYAKGLINKLSDEMKAKVASLDTSIEEINRIYPLENND